MNDASLSEFFETDYPAFGSYDNLRKICSVVDGLKLSQRKIIYTMLKKYQNPSTEIKTARLASSVAETTEYVHGEGSLCGVLDSMAASYCGSNNYPLIAGHGNFGSRFAGPGSAAAPRYTYCSISPLTLKLFNEDDTALCKSQIFEGSEIEPRFFMPIYPIILLNGNDGLTSGWKMQIYPRKPADVIKYIKAKLQNKKTEDPNLFVPYFKGFKGTTKLEQVNRPDGTVDNVFVNYGVIEKINSTTLLISELPITYNYASYISVLDKLVENGTIQDYDDKSDPKSDSFEFSVNVKRTFFNTWHDEDCWIQVFKLSKILSEQLNCIDVNNNVAEFTNLKDLLDSFIDVRLQYYGTRKTYLIEKYTQQLQINNSRYIWCKGIIDESIKIKNTPKDEVIRQLTTINGIIKKDDSYNYLLNMPLTSITKEKMIELKNNIDELTKKIEVIKATNDSELMIADISDLQTSLS